MENVKDGGSGQMSKTIAIAGTFDTKGKEFLYVKGLAEELGITPYMIHTGVFAPAFEVDVTNMEVAEAAGYDIEDIVKKKDRALATEALSKGMEILIPRLYQEGKLMESFHLVDQGELLWYTGNACVANWCPKGHGFHDGIWKCFAVCGNE